MQVGCCRLVRPPYSFLPDRNFWNSGTRRDSSEAPGERGNLGSRTAPNRTSANSPNCPERAGPYFLLPRQPRSCPQRSHCTGAEPPGRGHPMHRRRALCRGRSWQARALHDPSETPLAWQAGRDCTDPAVVQCPCSAAPRPSIAYGTLGFLQARNRPPD